MSIEILNLAFNAKLTGAKKSVLIALADRANHGGYCYPSMIDIAQRAGCTKRTVISTIKKLEAEGFISAIRDQGRVNKYIILIEKLSTTCEITSPVEVIHTSEIFVKTGETVSPKPYNHNNHKRAREDRATKTQNPPKNTDRQPHQKSKTGLDGLRSIKSIFAGMPTTQPTGNTQPTKTP